jgi:uncharacterized protein YgiM (DUF1202 family)
MKVSIFFMLALLALGTTLSGCQVQTWQPYAAFSYQPASTPTSQPTATKTQPTATAACVVTASKSLNLRSDAGTLYSVIEVLAAGDVLTLTGDQRGNWVQVRTVDGATGWVNSNYCKGK